MRSSGEGTYTTRKGDGGFVPTCDISLAMDGSLGSLMQSAWKEYCTATISLEVALEKGARRLGSWGRREDTTDEWECRRELKCLLSQKGHIPQRI